MERRNKTALSTQKKLEEKEEKEERKVHSSNQSTTGQGAQITDRSHAHREQALELTAKMSEAKKGSRELEKRLSDMGWLADTSKDQLRSIENNTCGTSIQL